jgi:hypothetical protein
MTDARIEHFTREVVARFGYLVTDFGFHGPDDAAECYVGYVRPPWSVWVVLDTRNRTVDTNVRFHDGVDDLHAPLTQLVVEAGVGRAQLAYGAAQTRRGMIASLDRQAGALRAVLPLLLGKGGYPLMMRAR